MTYYGKFPEFADEVCTHVIYNQKNDNKPTIKGQKFLGIVKKPTTYWKNPGSKIQSLWVLT